MSNFFSRLVSCAAERQPQLQPRIDSHRASSVDGTAAASAPAILEQQVEVEVGAPASRQPVSARGFARSAAAARPALRRAAPAAPGEAQTSAQAARDGARSERGAAPFARSAEVGAGLAAPSSAERPERVEVRAPQSMPPISVPTSVPDLGQSQGASARNQTLSPAWQATIDRLVKHLNSPPLKPIATAEQTNALAAIQSAPQANQSVPQATQAAQVAASAALAASARAESPAPEPILLPPAQNLQVPDAAESRAPVYRINIGRIELRATPAPAAPSQPAQPARQPQVQGTTLAEYQRQIRGRRP